MDLITHLKEMYKKTENIALNTNLKMNTREDIDAYLSKGLNVLPLKKHTKAPNMFSWTEKPRITQSDFQLALQEGANFGLRLDYKFADGNNLISIDIEDIQKEELLKHFIKKLKLIPANTPWTKTQSGAMHLYLKTERELKPIKVSDQGEVLVELRTGKGQQNVIGPSIYKEGSEFREYLTYGDILDAAYVPTDLIVAAFAELGANIENTYASPNSAQNCGVDFSKAVDAESENILAAIEILRKQKITRDEWIECGFALVNKYGKAAKPYFLQLSNNSNFPQDNYESVSKQFDNLLKTTKDKYSIGTLFHIAINYGFDFPEIKERIYEPLVGLLSFAEELEVQFLQDDTRDPNKLLGFPLTKFKELAGHVDGLQPGFYLLGAESNVGKTAVLTNMALDVLETNPNVTVMYFSLDDSRKYTGYRFLSIMTQLSINDTHKQQTDSAKAVILKNGRNSIIDFARSGRLIVKDTAEVYNIDQLKAEIQALPDKSKLVVFIDGLYNLEVGDKFRGGIREENIERARQVKLLVDMYRLPILTTGELRKKTKEEGKDKVPTMHDLMETGKFAYNANVVWMLYGKTEDLRNDEPTLTLEYVKNKLSDYKGIQYLTFKRATGTMSEVPIIQLAQPPAGPLFSDGGGHA